MKTALFIEDNRDIRENTTEMLELAGYHVFTASNGEEGLREVKRIHPDIILCDVMMPVLNGYEVITHLKKDPATATIPVVCVSASVEKKEVAKAMELGAVGYLRKPFDETELLNLLENTVGR